MGWIVPTYQDTDAMAEPPLWLDALFDLVRAVNEREGAIDVPKTEFYKGDGTEASDLVREDLDGLNLTSNEVKTNLLRVRDFIVDNVEYFTRDSGISEVWTIEDLETDLGGGRAIEIEPARPLSAIYWQTMQDALDKLIYARRTVLQDTTEATAYVRGYPRATVPSPSGATPSIAWSNLLSATETARAPDHIYFTTTLQFGVRPEPFAPFTGYDAICTRLIENIKFSNSFSGEGTAIEYSFGVSANSTLTTSSLISCGSIEPVDAMDYRPGLPPVSPYYAASDLDLPIGGSGYVNFEIELPASSPFSTPPSITSLRSVIAGFGLSAIYYFDIAAELTDQA